MKGEMVEVSCTSARFDKAYEYLGAVGSYAVLLRCMTYCCLP